MKFDIALRRYKTHAALARAAGVTKQAVTRWAQTGLVPERAAWRLFEHSRGKLKVNRKDYERVPPAAPAHPA